MKKGTRVSWTLKSGMAGGIGTVITNEADGEVQVKVESQWELHQMSGQRTHTQNEMHYVISCTVTWLSPVDTAD